MQLEENHTPLNRLRNKAFEIKLFHILVLLDFNMSHPVSRCYHQMVFIIHQYMISRSLGFSLQILMQFTFVL